MSTRTPARRRTGALPLAVTLAATLGVLVAGCGSGDAEEAGAASTAAAPDGSLEVTVTEDPDNTLVAHVVVSAPVATDVELEVTSAGTEPRRMASAAAAGSHEFTVVGLRARTEYSFEASSPGDGAASASMTTGALPGNAPSAEVVRAARDTGPPSDAGITFFGLTAPGTYDDPGDMPDGPVFYGVDPQGQVVWYLNSDEAANRAPLVRDAGDGRLLVLFESTVQEVTLAGEVVRRWDMEPVEGWHHDAVLLPGGSLLALGEETRKVDGRDVHGDVVVEMDDDGTVLWRWAALDHLDTTRFPGGLSTALASAGGLDWTHANSVVHDAGTDEVVVSLRSQGWVVAVDRSTDEIAWIAGDDTGTDPGFDAPFLELQDGTWPSGQHAATFTDDGELLVYDNRNETGGEQQGSRAVAYEIDREALTARQTFEVLAPTYTMALGDVDELPGGDVLVTAGGPGSDGDGDARLLQVGTTGTTVWEVDLPDTLVYRSERLPWAEVDRTASVAPRGAPIPSTGAVTAPTST